MIRRNEQDEREAGSETQGEPPASNPLEIFRRRKEAELERMMALLIRANTQ